LAQGQSKYNDLSAAIAVQCRSFPMHVEKLHLLVTDAILDDFDQPHPLATVTARCPFQLDPQQPERSK
jgi:hypothetical protein